MRTIRVVAWIIVLLMAANAVNVALNSGFDHGVGFDTFLAGRSDPWRMFIGNDLVSGLLLAVSWMIFRERGGRTIDIVAWVWMVMWWGNIVVAIYVLRAATRSGGDWQLFLLGRRAGLADAPPLPSPMRVCCAAGAILTAAWMIAGIERTEFAGIPIFGYLAGFLPIVLSFALLAAGRKPLAA